jgi:hypothetical protein
MPANVTTASGLFPIRRLDGAKWADNLRPYRIPAAQGSAVFVGDPVLKLAASALNADGVPAAALATAGVGNRITGVCCGFLGACAAGAGVANASMFGFSGQPGNVYRPAATALDYYALVNDDPEAEYVVMSNDNGGIPTAAAVVGKNVNLVAGAGSIYTGWSGWVFDPSTAGVGATLQFRITGVLGEPDNTVGLANCRFVGQINVPTELPNTAGI